MDNKQKKINTLFLTRWYPHRYDPMPGLFVQRHAEAVAKYCKVSLLYIHPDDNLKSKKKEIITETINDVFTVRIYYKTVQSNIPLISGIIKGFKYFQANLQGTKLIRKERGKPEILHVNILTRLGIFALLYKIYSGTPFIVTEHWSRYLPITNTYKGFFRKLFTRIVVKNASAVLPVTKNLKNAMLNHGLKNNNYTVVPNVVDTELFIPFDKIPDRKKKRIVHISCFEDRSKNISGILNVIKKLSEKRQDFECYLVGEGINLEKLKNYADKLKIKNKFAIFTGLLEDNKLIESINKSDLMLMFSNYENMPVVINESFACGVPVLSSNVGGIPEYVNKETGVLVEKKDESALLIALENFLDDNKKYDREKIREFALKNFSKEEVGKKIFKIYKNVLK
ncbi:MAG: glycosyltransferase [Bacteroidales bacterium]|nr:glycosyltransferase [Bacteroidales bacterium]